MAKTLNFAVVGLGMGGHHCKAITEAKNACLAAVCDLDEERLAAKVEHYGCKGYARYADLLKDKEIDAVCIVTESGKHAQMGIQAARAGKHIIVEKPIDVTPAAVKRLEDIVRETGVKVGCIFQSRMENCNLMLKRAIDKGKMGAVIGAHAHLPWWRGDDYFSGNHGTWRGTWKWDGGGSMMNQGIHTVDLIQWLAGRVERVCGFYRVHNHRIEAEDQTVACLEFENGALGTFYATTCAYPEGAQRVYMFGSKGSFSRHGGKLEFYEMGTPKERERMMRLFGGSSTTEAGGKDPMAVSADGHMLIIEDLVKAVHQDRETVIPLSSAKHAVEIACAIYQSARTGKAVRIRDIAR
ncbi:MAG TPA: Gfo/Idh/MocA family oxidoreductase [Candidatus Hydrogenedentes bacterium]|nr:Gfo/Idh/MocA family oxidoreductase [Candidatus Hydrogenedentota bacterium]HPG67271.1 Gfo/Idh/MocA family oxidoreductase [Candidatus Hydrogenedentota bacterium]